jgi:hypothetical protein
MRIFWRVMVLLLAVAGVAEAKKKEEPPVDRAGIHAALKKVGVMPARVAHSVPNGEAVALRFEKAVAERLRAAGFEVIEADAMRQVRADLAKAMGGLYDPRTGDATKEKIEARAKFERSEFLTRHPVDGFVYVGVVERDASSYSMTASWDGVEERVTGQSGLKSFMTGAAGAMGDGAVPALSLVLVLEDRDGKNLYGRFGGLQLLSYIRMGWVPKYHDVDPAYLLTDPARDVRALGLVFDPLTGQDSGSAKMKIALAPAALAEDRGALSVPREKLMSDHKRVALAALDIGDIGQRDAVRARYTELLRSRLSSLGFDVVRDADFDALWQEAESASGGFYDAATGRLDAARYAATRAQVFDKLRASHGVSAVVFPAISLRGASYASGIVKWDGAEQVVSGGGSKLGAMFGAGGRYVGRLQALSLQLTIKDMTDRELFADYGGIHSLSRFEHGRFVDLPESQLFSEPARDEGAVDLVLGEIAGKVSARGR